MQEEEIQDQTQKDTLQLESVETADTGSTDTDTVVNQNSKPIKALEVEDSEIPDAQDGTNTPIQGNDTNFQSDNEEDILY